MGRAFGAFVCDPARSHIVSDALRFHQGRKSGFLRFAAEWKCKEGYGMEMQKIAAEWKCGLVGQCTFPPIAKSAMDGAPVRLWQFEEKRIPPLRCGMEMRKVAAEWKCKEGCGMEMRKVAAEWKCERSLWNGNAKKAACAALFCVCGIVEGYLWDLAVAKRLLTSSQLTVFHQAAR